MVAHGEFAGRFARRPWLLLAEPAAKMTTSSCGIIDRERDSGLLVPCTDHFVSLTLSPHADRSPDATARDDARMVAAWPHLDVRVGIGSPCSSPSNSQGMRTVSLEDWCRRQLKVSHGARDGPPTAALNAERSSPITTAGAR